MEKLKPNSFYLKTQSAVENFLFVENLLFVCLFLPLYLPVTQSAVENLLFVDKLLLFVSSTFISLVPVTRKRRWRYILDESAPA